ncbi:hypothetical protein [Natronococcus pandeyae]|nr:hypothetical protein [Natronococcus pandeyae]
MTTILIGSGIASDPLERTKPFDPAYCTRGWTDRRRTLGCGDRR